MQIIHFFYRQRKGNGFFSLYIIVRSKKGEAVYFSWLQTEKEAEPGFRHKYKTASASVLPCLREIAICSQSAKPALVKNSPVGLPLPLPCPVGLRLPCCPVGRPLPLPCPVRLPLPLPCPVRLRLPCCPVRLPLPLPCPVRLEIETC